MLSENSNRRSDKDTVTDGNTHHGDVIDAATMMELLGTTTENARQISECKKKDNDSLKEINKKCFVEVYPVEMLTTGPPPAYSLTSPCLPPSNLEKQDWPTESPPYYDAYPPYPAGPPLLKIAYPKDIPGPTYACPKCEERFLYYRNSGIVQCPFCHSAISIGRYVRRRVLSLILLGLFVILLSLTFGFLTKGFNDCSTSYFVTFSGLAISGLLLMSRAFHMCFLYHETDRIDFS